MMRHAKDIIVVALLVITVNKVCSYTATVKCNIPDDIFTDEKFNGTCTVDYKGERYNQESCEMTKVRVKPRTPNVDTCNVTQLTAKDWQGLGCKADFTIICSKENVSIYLQCLQLNNNFIKEINVMREPVITTCPINATVDTVGLPITLTCEVSGDPSHYWVGWMHKNSIIQTGDEHSVTVLPSLASPNCTSYHLKVHSVKFPGKYTCQVFSIEGKHLSNVTHQVSIKEKTTKSSLLGTLFNQLFN